MNDGEWLKLKGFDFQKKLEDNQDFAERLLDVEDLKGMTPERAFVYGFRRCSNIMQDTFSDVFPQKEVNSHIDHLIRKLEGLKK